MPIPHVLRIPLMLTIAATCLPAADFYVSPDGRDSNPGRTRTAPFKSFSAAQQAARKLAGREPVTVIFADGIYYLPETVTFTDADSGTAKAPVLYRALNEGKAVISGGLELRNLAWKPYRDGIMQSSLPAGFTTDQLFVNGRLQLMARYPNFDPAVHIFDGYSTDAFSKERASRWTGPAGGFIHAMHTHLWGDYHYLITGKDASGEVTYVGGWQNNRQMGMHKTYRFVENIFEELDSPGEWFLNVKTSTLYFYPPAGLNLDTAKIEGVRLRHLVEFNGTEKAPVRFVTLRGFAFNHAARTFMDNKEPLLRSDWTTYRGGAIFFNGAEDCALEDATLERLGGNGVYVNNYNRRVAIRGTLIREIGAGGFTFTGDPAAARSPLFEYNQVQKLEAIDLTPGPKTNNYPADCLVENCLITRTSEVEKQTAPIQIEMSQSITVRHCSIYDVPRAGINIGSGCWGGHIIEGCDVFDTVRETGDHGSFNSWGRDRFWRPDIKETNQWIDKVPQLALLDVVKPITLRNNRWRCDHGWDIDLDDGSSNYRIYNNLLLHGGLKLREGFNRVVENNIMVDNGLSPHVWYDAGGDIFRRNIVFRGNYSEARMFKNKPWGAEMDHNLVHQPGRTTPTPATGLQRQSRRDEHSIIADAQFIQPTAGDFRVKESSPALALGFQNFPQDNFGVQKPALKAIARTPLIGEQTAKVAGRDASARNWFSAKVRNIVGESEMSAFGTPGETGVLVLVVPADSALARAGLRKDDVILSLGDQPVETLADLLSLSALFKPGATITLGIIRTQKAATLTLPIPDPGVSGK